MKIRQLERHTRGSTVMPTPSRRSLNKLYTHDLVIHFNIENIDIATLLDIKCLTVNIGFSSVYIDTYRGLSNV